MDQSNSDSGGGFKTPVEGEPQTLGHNSRNYKDLLHSYSPTGDLLEEAPEVRIERLGRQRPEVFKSLWAEIGFVFSTTMSQVLSVRFLFFSIF